MPKFHGNRSRRSVIRAILNSVVAVQPWTAKSVTRTASVISSKHAADPPLTGDTMKPFDEQKIVAAAIKQGGVVCFVPRPGRHCDVIRQMAAAGFPTPINGKQGFLTDEGQFVERRVALGIAEIAHQLLPGKGHGELFSEDVW